MFWISSEPSARGEECHYDLGAVRPFETRASPIRLCRKRSFATCGQGPRRSLTAVSKRFRVASRPRALRCSDGLRRSLCREASADGPDKPAYACCRGSAREGVAQKPFAVAGTAQSDNIRRPEQQRKGYRGWQ